MKLFFQSLFLYVIAFGTPTFASDIQTTTIGDYLQTESVTHNGNQIPLVIYSSHKGQEPDHRFLIQGGLHGNETLTTEFVSWLAQSMVKDSTPLLNTIKFEIHFVPSANPDSLGVSRYNQNEVNLNRNFSVLWGISKEPTGSHAFSEPETRAIKGLMEKHQYLASIDVHGYVNWIVTPTNLSKVDSIKAKRLAQKYQRWTQTVQKRTTEHFPKYKIKSAGSLGDGGAFEDWAFWQQGSMSICLEMFTHTRYVKNGRSYIDTFDNYKNYILRLFADAVVIDNTVNKTIAIAKNP